MQLAIPYGVRVWSTSWSPPAAYTTNGSTDCSAGSGSGALLSSDYSAYATWLANYVESVKTYGGISLYALSVQNEPDICSSYDSALMSAAAFDSFIKTNLGPAFASDGLSTLIMMPEPTGFYHFVSYANTCMTDASCNKYVGINAWHDYDATYTAPDTVNSVSNAYASLGKKFWETEASAGAGFGPSLCTEPCFDASMANALMWAAIIDNRIAVANANAWSYWWLINYYDDDDEGLVGGTGQAEIAQRAYVMGNYSMFVRPGYYRIDATHIPQSGVTVSAYQNTPGGNLVIVATNQNGSSVSQTFSITNAPTFTSVTPYITSASLSLASQSSVPVASNSFTYTLPADSVTTFVGTAITSQAATPVISPASGSYTSPLTVSMTCSTSTSTIFYTTDGSTPSESSAIYTGPFSQAIPATAQAICVASGYTVSSVASNSYTLLGTPAVSISPANLSFGSQSTGTQSPSQIITVQSTGTAPLAITLPIQITGTSVADFVLTTSSSPCPVIIAAGQSCQVDVAFAPTATGSRSASVSIANNAIGAPQGVPLSGTGTPGTGSSATVNWTNVHQEIDGFGASDAFAPSLLTSAEAAFFFGTSPGDLGLSLLRTSVPNNNDQPGVCSTVSSGCAGAYVGDMQTAISYGVSVWSTSWSPPAAYSTNGSTDCSAGSGSASLLSSDYSAYATWLANYVESVKTYGGISLYALSVQNEPDICASYDSSLMSAADFDTFIKTNLGPAFTSAGLTTLIMMPESTGSDDYVNYASACMTDSSCYQYVGINAWHDYDATYTAPGTVNSVSNAYASLGKKFWETEVSAGAGFGPSLCTEPCFDPSMANALMWAAIIDNRMAVANANAWNYWWLINYGNDDDEGLVGGTGQSEVALRAYVLGNYALFVRPGYYRIDATHIPQTGVTVSAYQDAPGGNLVIVATNQNSSSVTLTFSITNAPAFTSVTPYTTSASLSLAAQPAVAVSANSFTYTLPADSVTTFAGAAIPSGPAPTISSLSASLGDAGSTFTINGTNFGSTQGTSTATLNGTALTVNSWTATAISVTVPSASSTGNVIVTVGGIPSNGVGFSVIPYLSSLSVSSGPVGTGVTVTGTGFAAAQGASTLAFNGANCSPTNWTATTITCPVPAAATTGIVVATVGGNASNGISFTVTPHITSLSPTSGTSGTTVVISGTTFGASQGSSTVTFNGIAAACSNWAASSLSCTVPASATSGSVVVTVASQVSNAVSFSVAANPSISGVSPASATTGTAVTITGSNFGSSQGSSTVTFNGAAASVSSWGATAITCTVPAGATSGSIIVTVGGVQSNGVAFSVTPSLSKLSVSSGPVGASVTITGTGFGSTQGTSTVAFNGVACSATKWSTTSITCAVPSAATSGSVIVTVGGVASNGVSFTVTPQIKSLSPVIGPVGTKVTISGTTFGASQGSSTVKFNGVAATCSSWIATSLSCTVPATTTGNVVVTVSSEASNGVTFIVTVTRR
ncbi:MAG: IPT/TIG domain-containing protein [Candidatus Acidiferrales bacterium]